jgi:hypothetical protein
VPIAVYALGGTVHGNEQVQTGNPVLVNGNLKGSVGSVYGEMLTLSNAVAVYGVNATCGMEG